MLRVDHIIDDFMDLRAYVSHTLLLHRLTLGMSTPAKARMRLQDASVWPLVHRETLRFCDLTTTLYGIVSEPIDRIITRIRQKTCDLGTLRDRLVSGKEDSVLDELYQLASHDIHNEFVRVRSVWDEAVPGFSEEAVRQATEDLGPEEWIKRVRRAMAEGLALTVAALQGKEEYDDGYSTTYEQFWEEVEDLYVMTRTALVANAIQGGKEEHLAEIRSLQRLLRGTDGVVSSWGAQVQVEDRPKAIADQLRTLGFSTLPDLVACLRAGGVDSA